MSESAKFWSSCWLALLVFGGGFAILTFIGWLMELVGWHGPSYGEGDEYAALMMFSAMHDNPPNGGWPHDQES